MPNKSQLETLQDILMRRKDENRRDKKLVASLRGDGAVGIAFKEICRAGCDPVWLKSTLLTLRHYPFERPKKSISDKDIQRMKRRVAELEKLSHEFPKFYEVIFLANRWSGWPIHPQLVSPLLGELAHCLNESLEGGRWKDLVGMTATHKLPHLIGEIKKATGKPMYRQMAILIGAAYEIPVFPQERLKTFVTRNDKRLRRNTSHPKSGKHM